MTELWVARVASGRPTEPWRPDVPKVKLKDGLFSFKCLGGIPTDKVKPKPLPDPITDHLLIEVPAGQEKYVTGEVSPSLVSQADKLTVQMIRECDIDYESNADAFFASIPGLSTGNAALKNIAKELLDQAKPRGLSAKKAEAIRATYDLPALAAVGP